MLPSGAYNFTETEKEILEFWLREGFFKPEYDSQTDSFISTEELKTKIKNREIIPWSLICPPPNAYARPHIGNLSGYAYQDAMARYARMKGKRVLMIPGKDHAGLEGEGVFVREVLEKQGRYKFQMRRDDFYKEIWEFNMQNKAKALKDEKEMGLSADFDRDIFTLDPRIVNTVLETFIKLYKDGMVYKGVRLINWDPKAKSALADNQCIREERDGKLCTIKYPATDKRIWKINFRDTLQFSRILSNEKSIETRALNPEEKERYFGDISVGDFIICIDKSTEKNDPVYKKVKNYFQFKNIADAFLKLDWKNVLGMDNATLTQVENCYQNLSEGYLTKINNNGLVAIELQDLSNDDFITVATTRPETMFGDTAIAVNPIDNRYKKLAGAKAIIPLTAIEIPVITSNRVLVEFGTGALKITPAHSQDDFTIMSEWNKEHKNKSIGYRNVISKELLLTGKACGKYAGRKYKEALPDILESLKSKGLLVSEDSIKQNVLIAERTKALIEPLMSSQWFISVEKFKKPVIDMVKSGVINIHPKNMEEKFFFWMENLRDWAISRSLWWGYRMPVWYKGEIKEEIGENGEVVELIVVTPKEGEKTGEKMFSKNSGNAGDYAQGNLEGRESLTILRGIGSEGQFTENPEKQEDNTPLEGGLRRGNKPEMVQELLDYFNPNHTVVSINHPEAIETHFLRHAEAVHNVEKFIAGITDTKLTERGKEEILKAIIKLKSENYNLILYSPLKRAKETASIIAKELGVESIELALLKERNFGDYEGKAWEDVIQSNPNIDPEKFTLSDNLANAETTAEVNNRLEELIQKIAAEYKGKKILVVTHAVLIKFLEKKLYNVERPVEIPNLEYKKIFVPPAISEWRQDENVFDTWFSSGQWPYATLMAWGLLDEYFPTDVMETGFDILENWVSRMIMFSWFRFNKPPFKDVFLHGLVQGADGQKMSKSKGNVVDIDKVRAEFGTDAVRLVYFYQNTAGSSYAFTNDKPKNFKQFNNKIWNAAKYVLQNYFEIFGEKAEFLFDPKSAESEFSKKILDHTNYVTEQVIRNMDNFQFGLATFNLYQEFWHTFCDKLIEESKVFLKPGEDSQVSDGEKRTVALAMVYTLKNYLKLLHPFIPFITEKIWQEVPKAKGEHRAVMFNSINNH